MPSSENVPGGICFTRSGRKYWSWTPCVRISSGYGGETNENLLCGSAGEKKTEKINRKQKRLHPQSFLFTINQELILIVIITVTIIPFIFIIVIIDFILEVLGIQVIGIKLCQVVEVVIFRFGFIFIFGREAVLCNDLFVDPDQVPLMKIFSQTAEIYTAFAAIFHVNV